MSVGYFRPPHLTTRARVASTETHSASATWNNLADLSFAVAASGVYVARYQLWHFAAATTTGISIRIQGPASPTLVLYSQLTRTSGTAVVFQAANAFDAALTSTGVGSTTIGQPSYVELYLANGANAGTVSIDFSTEIDTSQVSVLGGASFVEYQRLA